MNKLWLLSFSVFFFCVDLMPLKDTQHTIVKRSNNITVDKNSTIPCNETLGNCNNLTLNNSSKRDNLTNVVNQAGMKLNLTEVCGHNATVRCNGSLVNMTQYCNSTSVEKVVLLCINESSDASFNVSLLASNVSQVTSNVTVNVTLSTSNATLNSSVQVNSTGLNVTTVNGTINVVASNSLPLISSKSNTLTPSLLVASSSTSVVKEVQSSVTASSSVKATYSEVKPSSTITLMLSTTEAATTPKSTTSMSTTPQSTTQTSTIQSTTKTPTTIQSTVSEKATTKSTEQVLTTHKSTNKPTTHESTTEKTTKLSTTQVNKETPTTKETKQQTTEKSTSLDAKTEQSNAVTKMKNPYNSAKNIKFFYVNVLIPVGIGVCGALLIALSVLLFKCCRRNKVKKVRYFGKSKGYSRNNMDHMNLLANSSDEE